MKSTDVLSDVHELMAHWCLDKLREGDVNAADLNIIRQFLKDNQITAQPVEETSFGELAKALPEIENVVQLQKKRA
jgi:hypothetical protein